jgi:hypothetical protein
MSQARTVWHAIEARQRAAVRREWLDVLLAACLLAAIAANEVVFLHSVAGPESAALLSAPESIGIDD